MTAETTAPSALLPGYAGARTADWPKGYVGGWRRFQSDNPGADVEEFVAKFCAPHEKSAFAAKRRSSTVRQAHLPAQPTSPGRPARPAAPQECPQSEDQGEYSALRTATSGGEELTDETARRLVLTPASSIRMKVTRWTWEGRLPLGALSLIGGREGIGKSLTLAWLCAEMTRGTLPGAHLGQPRPVLYVASEDSWAHTVAPRLAAAGADLSMVYRVTAQADGAPAGLVLPLDVQRLALEMERVDAALIVIDPLASVLDGKLNTHYDTETRQALEPLSRLAERTGASVVGLVHHSKAQTTDALSLVLGSRAFTAVSRSVMAAVRDPDAEDGSVVLALVKNNLGRLDIPALRYIVESIELQTPEGPTQVGRLRWTGEEQDVDLHAMIRGGANEEDRTERNEAAEWLSDFLLDNQGEATAAEIMKAGAAEGFSRDVLKRAKKRAGIKSVKCGMSGGWRWRLPLTPSDEGSEGGGAQGSTPFTPFTPFVLPSKPVGSTW